MHQDDFNPEDHGIEYNFHAEMLAKQHIDEIVEEQKQELIKKEYLYLSNHYNRKYSFLSLGEEKLIKLYNKIIHMFEKNEQYEICKEVLDWKSELKYLTNF